MRRYVCYCGSTECPEAQCRFVSNREEYDREMNEFWAQWAEAGRRLEEENGQS
jgi:hypothetical protein